MPFKPYAPDQGELFGYRVSDCLDDDDPAYLLAEVLGRLDLSGFDWQGEGAGQPPYHPAMMLGLLLYGMMRGLFSSRALAAACRRDMGFIYLAAGARPCFKTICNFRNAHGTAIRALMAQVLALLRESGLAAAGRLVLDSTRIRANAGRDKMIRADSYELALRQIDNYLCEGRKRDSDEDDDFGPDGDPNVLPPSLRRRPDRLRELEGAIRRAKQEGRKAVSPNDPQCNQMRISDSGKVRPGYALQAGIDADSGLLTVCDAGAEPTDNGFVTEAARQHQANVGAPPRSLDADSGYFNAEALAALSGEGVDVCVPDSTTVAGLRRGRLGMRKFSGRVELEDFQPADGDAWRCPQGRQLAREGTHSSHGKPMVTYRAPHGCRQCPRARACLRPSDRGRRRLEVSPSQQFILSNRERFTEAEHRRRYRRRGGCIERVFGHLRRNLGLRQWLHCGLEKVRTTAALLGIAHNVLVLARWRAAPA